VKSFPKSRDGRGLVTGDAANTGKTLRFSPIPNLLDGTWGETGFKKLEKQQGREGKSLQADATSKKAVVKNVVCGGDRLIKEKIEIATTKTLHRENRKRGEALRENLISRGGRYKRRS